MSGEWQARAERFRDERDQARFALRARDDEYETMAADFMAACQECNRLKRLLDVRTAARSERQRLANRRAGETFAIEAGGLRYTATVGRFDDGRAAEIFLTSNKVGSAAAIAACDAAVLASIALQHGVPLDVLRHALMRDAQGRAIGPLGVVLDRIAGETAQ
jgi:hypothetical protein